MFESLLIANRGEIACRVIRTARRMGIRTVAVYSEADRDAQHVELADSAICIGGAPAGESYLNQAAVIDAAIACGAEAIHPGYGFLSENAAFAEACAAAELVFVGPTPDAIRRMGSKDEAKSLARAAGVAVIPGCGGAETDDADLLRQAESLGFPLLIKAVAGGGGKGMRRVDGAEGFADALTSARREAVAAFGSDAVLLERFIERPRHVEVQVFGDRHGNLVHLFERDCSVQRRHQKVIEEAPSPGVDAALREALGEAAVNIAATVDYVGAGTVEFVVTEQGEFYFLEMNTRLQVEHPVTEMITGLDLVEWQLRVAAGERLPLTQDLIDHHGHSIEVRLYAEDPGNQFLPSVGRLERLELPAGLEAVRLDSGVVSGDTVSPFYDPMLAKVIAWGETRDAARLRLLEALQQSV
ncbi:MAG: biotin carboxylase N-terminal domain-containing protein, partial [Pseudomonadota bacterium]|nr:biotin carboxylase N-terminal domain-containing protein [Pseudomonadota bacterium]